VRLLPSMARCHQPGLANQNDRRRLWTRSFGPARQSQGTRNLGVDTGQETVLTHIPD
jgi:hypothetical protein